MANTEIQNKALKVARSLSSKRIMHKHLAEKHSDLARSSRRMGSDDWERIANITLYHRRMEKKAEKFMELIADKYAIRK